MSIWLARCLLEPLYIQLEILTDSDLLNPDLTSSSDDLVTAPIFRA